jgi:aspartyl-tRNA(Asn)/glutamyl-tRNA(Gln) amidotransferase subunit B
MTTVDDPTAAGPDRTDGWELVVGLEVHCELATRTKIFCSCRNGFGDEPNTNVCPVCLGLPGSLPVLNRQAVELAMRIGTALGCTVVPSVFHRKNYFYPDMPKDFQVSQYDRPINVDGRLVLPDGWVVGIERAHLEEDTGKSTHVGAAGAGAGSAGRATRIHDADHSLIDYNRAGVPLVEIVSRPDIRTAEQARAYVNELRAILLATGASDAKMEEGSMRVDANVSVHRPGEPFGTRCEIKNLNSVRSLGRAIDHEVQRQIALLESGQRIVQETRHWDEDAGRTRPGRNKEEAEDYRYFQEPDLVPVEPGADWLAAVRAALPSLPAERRERLAGRAGVAPADVALVVERDLDGLVLGALDAGGPADRLLVHAVNNLVDGAGVMTPAAFAALAGMEAGGALTATQAKAVLAELVAAGGEPAAVAAARGFESMGDDALAAAVDAAIAADPGAWERFKAGDRKVTGFFVGHVMKATRGKADGKAVSALLAARASQA